MIPRTFQAFLRKLHIRRNYKDRFFLRCFRDKKDLLQLYNSVAGSHYTEPEDLDVTTLEDGIYMSMKNDISFIIFWDMCLFEHQSTYNPNMPLRGLFYFARLYEVYVQQNRLDIYGSKKLEIPLPRFIVFYNGDNDTEDVLYLRLSDLYKRKAEKPEQWGKYPQALECTAVMLNINYGHNAELMNRCGRLHDYAYFIQLIRDYLAQGIELEEAISAAIDQCIEKGVLADILIKCKSEVFHMLLTEFDEKAYKKRLYRDGVQDGIQQGISGLIYALQKKGNSYEDIEKIICEAYGLKADEAETYMEKYWEKSKRR